MKAFLKRRVAVWLKDSDLCIKAFLLLIDKDPVSGSIDMYLGDSLDGEIKFSVPYDNVLFLEHLDEESEKRYKSTSTKYVASRAPEEEIQSWQDNKIPVEEVRAPNMRTEETPLKEDSAPYTESSYGNVIDSFLGENTKSRKRRKKSDVISKAVSEEQSRNVVSDG
jgi:hypothetical protein